jgi:hypothetical protein
VPDLNWFERALLAPVFREFERVSMLNEVFPKLGGIHGAMFDAKSALLWIEAASKATEDSS